MSVVDQLKNLFSKKSDVPSTQNSGELSLAMPDHMVDSMARSSMGSTSRNNAISMGPADDSLADDESTRLEEPGEAELIAVPLLGRRTIVTHQRILFTLLSLALVVLGSVAIFAVRQ